MQKKSAPNPNPWTEIPLGDYEQHMSHSSVGQFELLNSLTEKYLIKLKPSAALFLGIAAGNGLEHIDNNITKHVIGIDINPEYLQVCFERYHDKIDSLQLLELDISKDAKRICSSDFVWAALIMEYTGIDKCLEFSKNNMPPGGHLIVTIQSNNNLQSVSPTGIETVKKAGSIFSAVDIETLLKKSKEMAYTSVEEEVNQLPNGKSFLTFDLMVE
jgi:hypothetical protein